ncbi:MAG: hypothetical protein PX637_16425 [Microcystis sp. M53601_WE4]|nr:hypothetical protein [Microcystis sp. M53601_WE4]
MTGEGDRVSYFRCRSPVVGRRSSGDCFYLFSPHPTPHFPTPHTPLPDFPISPR